jgi:4'-phosphopantetheinyl transferase
MDQSICVLNEEEMVRSSQFLNDLDKEAYAAAHTLKRLLIAYAVNNSWLLHERVRPNELQFKRTIYGKPILVSPQLYIDFSISHTRGAVAVLVSTTRELVCGVDIEGIFPKSLGIELEKEIYTPKEIEIMNRKYKAKRVVQTMNWTRKEAFLKLTGLGLSLPMKKVGFLLNGFEEPGSTRVAWVNNDSIKSRTRIAGNYCVTASVGMNISNIGKERFIVDPDNVCQERPLVVPTKITALSVNELIKCP